MANIKRTWVKPVGEQVGTLASRNTGPVTVTYMKHGKQSTIRLSARGKSKSDIIRGHLPHKPGTNLLDLPVGVVFVPNK